MFASYPRASAGDRVDERGPLDGDDLLHRTPAGHQELEHLPRYVNETGEAGPLELYDPAVTFTTRGDVGGPETFSGHRGMADAIARFGEVWAKTAAHITELVEGDDVVVAVVQIELRSHAGVELEVEEAWAYWLRDSKLTRIE